MRYWPSRLLALPVNAFLNYCFIFGKLGMPRLGGVGAGVATGITYWLEFAIFVWIVHKLPAFEHFRIFKDRFHLDIKQLRENLSIGVPIGLAMFMEASIFGVVALFIAKFGTVIIAAHQAALGFTSLLYMTASMQSLPVCWRFVSWSCALWLHSV